MTTTAQTALADQLAAAVAHASREHRQIARHIGAPLRKAPHHPWLSAQLSIIVNALTEGTARLCPHITAAPTVLHSAAWAPGDLVCSACIRALSPSDAEDSTCDRCRRPARPIYPGMAHAGVLLLSYGLCRRCARRTGLGSLPAEART
ncbi:hypothetical protein [Planobispora rosea]|uniref:hypothetical protein n=1 Tax=Planobispora rosea TaxID=35762 RepID=UPI00083B16FF|nr:hypothetical protein [Planobispora rosea]